MKKIASRILTMVAVLALAISCFSITAMAATTYTDSLIFHGEHKGVTREYTGRDMHWSGSTYTQYQGANMPTTFYVSLYRQNLIGSSLIGGVSCPRVGYHDLVWTNVGSGKYYFYYVKARDNANVVSNAITMRMT